MKNRFHLLVVFILIVVKSFSQNNKCDTILVRSDLCLPNDSTQRNTITKTTKVFNVQGLLKNIIEEDINFCFRSTPNTCYTIRHSKHNQDSYLISSELDFPIETDNNITGVVFVNFVPIFLLDLNILDTNLFIETSKFVCIERVTTRHNYIPCILTDTFPYQFSGSVETKLYHFVINSCNRSKEIIDPKKKDRKPKKKCRK